MEAIENLINSGKVSVYPASEFTEDFIKNLKSDKKILENIRDSWTKVNRDPKLIKFIKELNENQILKENKLIIFTESRETSEYLCASICNKVKGGVICYNGQSSQSTRDKVIENFDAKIRNKKDDYRILISTEVLAEGVNLHRSNVVINYDIPWNPTRMMQRVGRINRVDTIFDVIYTFNFFPPHSPTPK